MLTIPSDPPFGYRAFKERYGAFTDPDYREPGSVTVQSLGGRYCTIKVKWERVGNELRNQERVELPSITSRVELTGVTVRRTDGTDLRMELKNPIRAEPGAIIGLDAHALRIELHDHLYAFPGTEPEEEDYEEDDDDRAGPNDDEPEEAPLAAAQDELAQIYAETGRRCGRTTRLLGVAVRRALAGEKVAFVTHNPLMAREAINLINKHYSYANRHRYMGDGLTEFRRHDSGSFVGSVRIFSMSNAERRLYPRNDAVYDHVVAEELGVPFVPRADAPKLPDYRYPVVARMGHGQTGDARDAFTLGRDTVNEAPFVSVLEKLGITLKTHSYVKPGIFMLVSPQDYANMQAETPREREFREREDKLRANQADLAKKLRSLDELKKTMGHPSPEQIREILAPADHPGIRAMHEFAAKRDAEISGTNSVTRGESPGLSLAELHALDVERVLSATKP